METFVKKIFTRGVIMLVGILVAVLLFFSGFTLTNTVLEKHSKHEAKKEVSLLKYYIFNS